MEKVITSWERYKRNYDRDNFFRWVVYLSRVYQVIDGLPKPFRYTYKEQEEIVEWCLSRFRFRRGFFLTIHVPSYLTNGHVTEKGSIVFKNPDDYFFQISNITKRFFRRLERRVYGKQSKNRLEKFTVIEGCYNRYEKNHIHILVETPEHLSMWKMREMIMSSHGSFIKNPKLTNHILRERGLGEMVTCDSRVKNNFCLRGNFQLGKLHIQELDQHGDKQRLYRYLTKEERTHIGEINDGRKGTDTVDWKNTYEKSSKYLSVKNRETHEKRVWKPYSRKGLGSFPLEHPSLTGQPRPKMFEYEPDMSQFTTKEPDWISKVKKYQSSLSRFRTLVKRQSHVERDLCEKSSSVMNDS